jgi:hypothetical protein
MNGLEDRLTEASTAVREAAAHAVAPPLRQPRSWPRPWHAVALAGAAVAVAIVAGLVALLGPADETVRVADTTPAQASSIPEVATTVPSGGSTTDCSAAGATPPLPQQGLPAPVAALRDQIGAAAARCDIVALESLAGPDLVTSFGGGGPERFAEAESSGEPLLDILVGILDTPYARQALDDGSEMYVWPSAFAYQTWQEIPPADLEALLGVYTQSELDELSGFGSYAGWRVGITANGDWQFFVAGD